MDNKEIKSIPMIRLENLSKYYVGNNEVALGLRKLNLEFEIGELVAITGESGSGKSTLLNVLSGSDSYEEGEMFIKGQSTSYYDEEDWENYRREYIGFIYQSYNLIDSYSVYENVNVALVVKGGQADNRKRVMKYLDRVGIAHLANKKATQLSSGQKQRLAIARALAKETEIIVADEPTGNLDSENSAEVMALLNELAVDKLVFVVTHNYDEIEAYATRKIRMRDGQVEEDINLREKKLSERYLNRNKSKDDDGEITGDKEEKESDNKTEIDKKEKVKIKKAYRKNTAKNIAMLNRRNKPVSYSFLLVFTVVVSVAFFILLGSFFSNLDNTTSKNFSRKQFKNSDITRIIVKNSDNAVITDEDVEKLKDISKVTAVDKYDSVSDMFYCTEENVDYKQVFNKRTSSFEEPDYMTNQPIKMDKYMKTSSCIDKDDLSAGSLPEKLYDIVLYSDDESIIGKQKDVFIGNEKLWGKNLAKLTCTVTGILSEETEQIYFSEEAGKMFVVQCNEYASRSGLENLEDAKEDDFEKASVIIKASRAEACEVPQLVMMDFASEEELESFASDSNVMDYEKIFAPIILINENLTSNEVFVSEEFVKRSYAMDPTSGKITPRSIRNILKFYVKNDIYRDTYNSRKISFNYALSVAAKRGMIDEHLAENGIIGECLDGDTKGYEELLEAKKQLDEFERIMNGVNITMVAQEKLTGSAQDVIEVSYEMYERLFGTVDSTQAAVYIKDYAYAENVLDDIKSMDYEVASVYQAAATEYNMELVSKKAISMGISLGAFVLVFFVGVFIIGLIMSLGDRDVRIMRLIGLERNTMDEINKYTIFRAMATGVIIGIIMIEILYLADIKYIIDIVKYYRIRHYIVYIAMICGFVGLLLNRAKKRMRKMR